MPRQISNAEQAGRENAAEIARTRQTSRETTPAEQRVANDTAGPNALTVDKSAWPPYRGNL
jgi:hypothetical protein